MKAVQDDRAVSKTTAVERLLTKAEAADRLNVGPRFVERCIVQRRIRYVRIGRLFESRSQQSMSSSRPALSTSGARRLHVHPSDDRDSWLQLRQIPHTVVSRCSTCRNSHTYPQQPSTCQRRVAPNYVVRSSTAPLSNYVAVAANRSLPRNSLNSYNSPSTA